MTNKYCQKDIVSFVFFTALTLTPAALADEVDDVGGAAIETLTVTGVRTPIDASAMSNALTIITADQLATQQITQIADVLRQIPGISVTNSGPLGSLVEMRMRGGEANHVLVLIDGVEANDPATGDAFLFQNLTTVDIERVEVIRGPQSALWGSDAVAGVINIVTRGGGEALEGGGHGEGGSFGTVRGGVNLRFGAEGFAVALAADYLNSQGSNLSRVGDEKDGYENTTLSAKLKGELSDALTLTAHVRHMAAQNDFDAVDYGVTGLPTDADNVTKTRRTYMSSEARLALLDGRWIQRAGVTWLDSANDTFVAGVFDSASAAERLKVSYQSTYSVQENHHLTVAFDAEKTTFEQVGQAQPWGDPNHQKNIKNQGYLVDYVGTFYDALTITASLRYDNNSDFDDITTWRTGANYALPNGATRLRFSVGRGQKAPGFIERFGFYPEFFVGQPNLLPESSKSYEVGVDQALWAERIKLSVTYFHSVLKDEIDGFVFDPDRSLYTAENRAGESIRQGLEVSVGAMINDQWHGFANYSFTDATEPNGLGGMVRELRRPRSVASAGLTYVFMEAGSIALTANYTGDHSDRFFPPYPQAARVVTLDEYLLVRVAARYPLKEGISLYGRLENAFNADYEDVFGFNTPARGAYAGLRLDF